MVYIDNDEVETFLVVNKYEDNIPKDYILRLIKKFVENDFKYLDCENKKVMDVQHIVKQAITIVLYAYSNNHNYLMKYIYICFI